MDVRYNVPSEVEVKIFNFDKVFLPRVHIPWDSLAMWNISGGAFQQENGNSGVSEPCYGRNRETSAARTLEINETISQQQKLWSTCCFTA